MRGSKFRKTRPLLWCGVLAFTLATAPALAMGGGGPPLASGPDRATSGSYDNYSYGANRGGYGGANHGPGGQRWDCKFYNPYVPFQNQQYCQ
jgi:hypothetical protein